MITVALVSLFISFLSLAVAGISLYFSKIQAGRLVGNLSYLLLWRFSSNKDGRITAFNATPAFWLANVGSRPLLVADLRLCIRPSNEKAFCIYPSNSVPKGAIDVPSEFHEHGRLSLGGPFQGISLIAEERWACYYNFHIPAPQRELLVGSVEIGVEVKYAGTKKWCSAITETLEFGSHPLHVRPINSGVGSESICVYSKIWNQRSNRG
jgi:hypothetical protein